MAGCSTSRTSSSSLRCVARGCGGVSRSSTASTQKNPRLDLGSTARMDLWATRFSSQLLGAQRADDVAGVCRHLLAVQAQDLRSARLAIRARTSGSTVAAVDGALTQRELVVSWLNRGTLHLVAREDYWWLHALTTPQLFTTNARRLTQTGVTPADAERGVAAIEVALEKEGPLTRDQLRERVRAVGVETAGQALVHVLKLR